MKTPTNNTQSKRSTKPTAAAVTAPETSYHPYAATWELGPIDGPTIYHVPPGGDPTAKDLVPVATVVVNSELGADPHAVLRMMAAGPVLWRELQRVAARYVWGAGNDLPDVAEDFAAITNLLAETAHVHYVWDPVQPYDDATIDARNTEAQVGRLAVRKGATP